MPIGYATVYPTNYFCVINNPLPPVQVKYFQQQSGVKVGLVQYPFVNPTKDFQSEPLVVTYFRQICKRLNDMNLY